MTNHKVTRQILSLVYSHLAIECEWIFFKIFKDEITCLLYVIKILDYFFCEKMNFQRIFKSKVKKIYIK